jgi:hypothetical protein
MLQNKLNYKCANTEGLHVVAAAVGATLGQQPHVQPKSIPDPGRFDGSGNKVLSFI